MFNSTNSLSKHLAWVILLIGCFSCAYADKNTSTKPLNNYTVGINKNLSFFYETELNYDLDAGRMKEISWTPGFEFKIPKKFKLSSQDTISFEGKVNYLHITDSSLKTIERRPRASITTQWNHSNHKFELRHRLEHRNRKMAGKDSGLRYRPRIKFKPNWRWTPLKLAPYLSDEFFISEGGYGSQEIEAGVKLGLKNWSFVVGNVFVIDNNASDSKYIEDIIILEFNYKFAR
ncbi:MAG: DUF2490 domain-containing protein [Planctomycetes bacterium]|nr:DUF2490 domain-containing protein [Planctomycetota bacterium]